MKKIIGLILSLTIASGLAQATIYTWKGVNGNAVYSDHPPPTALHKGPVKEFMAKPIPSSAQLKTASGPLGTNANASQVAAKKIEEQNVPVRAENCRRARYNVSVLQTNLSQSRAAASAAKAPYSPGDVATAKQLALAQDDVKNLCSIQ